MKIVKIQGGLGNQMFQYALYSKLLHFEDKVYIDKKFFKGETQHNGYELEKIFKIKSNDKYNFFIKKFFTSGGFIKKIRKFVKKIYKKLIISQEDVKYFEEIFEYMYYDGYWQSEKFFKDIEKEIKQIYTFPEIFEDKNLKIKNEIEQKNSVSIHIRRGDYIGNRALSNLAPLKYYEEAIKYIKNEVQNTVFFIFSDDIDWCKKNLIIKDEVFYIDWNKGENSYRDMQLMSLCKHNIIPNSSFSWWGAWLNDNPEKIVIAPEKWFTDESNYNYTDIVPQTWIKIKNY